VLSGVDAALARVTVPAAAAARRAFFYDTYKMALAPPPRIAPLTRVTVKPTGCAVVPAAGQDDGARSVQLLVQRTLEAVKADIDRVWRTATGNDLPATQVQWVLTVPAIWDDDAKTLMRHAAVDAGKWRRVLRRCPTSAHLVTSLSRLRQA
jgi:hypothetical protein